MYIDVYGSFLLFSVTVLCSLILVLSLLPVSAMYFFSQLLHGISYTTTTLFILSNLSFGCTNIFLSVVAEIIVSKVEEQKKEEVIDKALRTCNYPEWSLTLAKKQQKEKGRKKKKENDMSERSKGLL